jgi:AcrR family transcriptional regulator
MTADDWLLGGDRRLAATERIYEVATDLIAHAGINGLEIDKLAARVHCSRATVYRYAGGKTQIRNAVLTRAAARIAEGVRSAVDDLSGPERLVASIVLALQRIRADPLGQLMIGSVRGGAGEIAWLTESPLLGEFAADLAGLAGGDAQAAKWVVRVVLSLMYWPADDDDAERRLVERFVAPAFSRERQPGGVA